MVLVAIVVIVAAGGMLLPGELAIQRSTEINAPADIIYPQVNNLKAWEAWDPWHAKEPEMGGSVYSGPEEGPGATHCWDSENPEIGKGCMAISESQASSFINTDLVFDGSDSASGGFKFNETDGVTSVVWTMDMSLGMNPFFRILGNFMIKGALEGDFEYGLAHLKEICEAIPVEKPREYPIEISVVPVTEQPIYSIRDSATTFEIHAKLDKMYEEIETHIEATGSETAGPRFSIWHVYNPGGHHHAEAAVPVKEATEGNGRVKDGFISAGNAVRGIHLGAYDNAAISYHALEDYMVDNGYHQDGPPWEVYITDRHEVTDTSQWVTHIFFRVEDK